MKKLVLIAAILSLSLLTACNKKAEKTEGAAAASADTKAVEGKGKPAEQEKPIELTDTADLGAKADPDALAFKGLKAKVPAGAAVENGLTGVLVRIGERQAYEISALYEPGHVAKNKSEATSDKLDKLVKFHIDTPEAILWESKSELGGENNFHFAAEVKVGQDAFKCFNKGYGNFTKAQAEALLKSCQSLSK